jgi:hypothetical protein
MSGVWKVVGKNGRSLFEGLEDDAREFIVNKFPRMHNEPFVPGSIPDAALHSPDADVKTGKGIEVHTEPKTGFVALPEFEKAQETAIKNGPNAPVLTWQEQAKAAGYSFDDDGKLIAPKTWQEQAKDDGHEVPANVPLADNGGNN